MTNNYKSDIVLGKEYQDIHTGLIGKAVAVGFYEYACERVTLRYLHDGDIKEMSFDAPELKSVSTGETATSSRPGGPARSGLSRGDLGRR